MAGECTRCGCKTDKTMDTRSRVVYETIEYKERKPLVIGFPAPENHTAKGWKFRKIGEVLSALCPDCVQKVVDRKMEKRPAAIKQFKEVLKIEAGVVLVCVVIFLLNHFFRMPGLIMFLTVAGLAVWTGYTVWAGVIVLDINPTQAVTAYHDKRIRKQIDMLAKKLNRKIHVLSAEDPIPTYPGKIFSFDRGWDEFVDPRKITENEKNTGWSLFMYVREITYGSPQCTDPKMAAENLNVEHLGIFLEGKDENGAGDKNG
ncbi:MAG: hypothetical protein PHQ61_08660 [Candidatus Omnitrophica bacterium]|nr:hypothetical protein [Candidatus Omnitrophota bacterium]